MLSLPVSRQWMKEIARRHFQILKLFGQIHVFKLSISSRCNIRRKLLLRNKEEKTLSWEDTYKSMADENENWDDFNIALLDGLEDEDFEY
ncbi:hypothetical protein [Desulfonatronovibrio magnus]|uniref:hypothetical protein n=1 Tax=Desulfonatronovibrio magnus TaxID=698827 RepID=UPI0005EB2135|nr:hypothetical protein [Desulfonatronovibrio magnus]